MSRHRVKNVGYDDDEYEDDEGYESPDPEEQEFLKQCTALVSQQLRAGQPSVTATTEEIQEALWHYYNDIEKSTNYLRGTLAQEYLRPRLLPRTRVFRLAWWAAADLRPLSQARRKRSSRSRRLLCQRRTVSNVIPSIWLSIFVAGLGQNKLCFG